MMTLREYVARYQLRRGIRANSAEQYRIAARSLDTWAHREIALEELCADLINRWIVDLETRLANATVRTRKRHVTALWRSAVAEGLCPNPYHSDSIRRVVLHRRPTHAWTVEEVRVLVDVARGLDGTLEGNLTRAHFWEQTIRDAWDTALRLGDLLAAQVSDFGSDGSAVLYQSKTQRPVFVRMLPGTLALHERIGWRTRGRLVPWPFTREHFRKEFERIVLFAGLSGSFRKIRRSSATNIEMRHPGWGAIHLGHLTGFRTADAHYFDFRIIGSKKPDPEEL
jgi:integrase